MAVSYNTFSDILDDVLFRTSEEADGDYLEAAQRYILRGYGSILYGDADLLFREVPEWWWLRKAATIILDGDTVNTGTYNLPTDFIRMAGPTYPTQVTRTELNRETGLEEQVVYTARQEPIIGMGENDLERIRQSLAAANRLDETPRAFALVSAASNQLVQQIRFSSNGPEDELLTLNYQYYQQVETDSWNGAAEPIMPRQYRKILADYGVYFLWIDKDDDRATGVGQLVQNSFKNMVNKERTRNVVPNSNNFDLQLPGRRTITSFHVDYNSGVRRY